MVVRRPFQIPGLGEHDRKRPWSAQEPDKQSNCYYVSGISRDEKNRNESAICEILRRAFDRFPHARTLKIVRNADESYGVECERPSTLASIDCELPDFVAGLSQTIDIGDTYHHWLIGRDGAQVDYHAILNDWQIVGQDLSDAARDLAKHDPDPASKKSHLR